MRIVVFLLEHKVTHGILEFSTFTPFCWWPKWQRMDGVTLICHDCLLSASCSPSCSQWSRMGKHRRLFRAKQNKASFWVQIWKRNRYQSLRSTCHDRYPACWHEPEHSGWIEGVQYSDHLDVPLVRRPHLCERS